MKFQKFRLNRINYLILILLSIVFIPKVNAIVDPTSNFYVNDYANILSEETEKYIMDKSVALEKVDGTQIVVVTVKNLEGLSLEDYSLRLARKFKIGSSSKDNGLLILLALEERALRTEVGAGLEGIIPDGKSGRFQDTYMIPYLKNNDWDNGIKNGYDAYYKEIVTLNNLNLDYTEPEGNNINNSEVNGEFFMFAFYVIPLTGAMFGSIIRSLKKKQGFCTVMYFLAWTVITKFLCSASPMYMILMFFNIILFLVCRFTSGSGGTFGGYGGSSFRSSSSSGRSFSGGGGSFRGGGSSRRF